MDIASVGLAQQTDYWQGAVTLPAKPIQDRKLKLESHRRNNLTANGQGDAYIYVKRNVEIKAFKDLDFENAEHYEVIEQEVKNNETRYCICYTNI